MIWIQALLQCLGDITFITIIVANFVYVGVFGVPINSELFSIGLAITSMAYASGIL
jgi:hypothetical protein